MNLLAHAVPIPQRAFNLTRTLGAVLLGLASVFTPTIAWAEAKGGPGLRTDVVPARVVSVGGAITEIVYAIGAADRLVAVDSTSTWPAAANALPRIGYMRSMSAEGVLSTRPDVVLAAFDAGPPAALAQLRSAGVAVTRLSGEHSIDSVVANVLAVGKAVGSTASGEALARKIERDWADVRNEIAGLTSRPRVLFLLAHSGNVPLVSGAGTAADAMIRNARGVNAVAQAQGYKPLTSEGAVAAAPDVILITREGLAAIGGTDRLLAQPGLAATPAGRARRVVALDALALLGFGPRTPATVRELARALHDPR